MTKKQNITRYTSEEIKEMPLQAHAVDWDRIKNLTDEEITQAITEDPDAAPVWTSELLRQATLVVPEDGKKLQITIKLNPRTLEWFKRQGSKGYQSRINAVLDAYVSAMEHHA